MHNPPLILIVDDNETNRDILLARLQKHGYQFAVAADGEEALKIAAERHPDLILLDVMMPKLDGFAVTRRLKGDNALPYMPIVLITARTTTEDIVAGFEAGADEYLTKPVDQIALVARVQSMLRAKELNDKVREQASALAAWNKTLEARVAEQLSEIERISRLKRFLAPQVADLVLSMGHDGMLDAHRREVSVVFCDVRGFTGFAEIAEPEEVMSFLREYHGLLGNLIFKHEGTLDKFAGDGLMVIFNDPIPCADPAVRAVRMAVEMRQETSSLLRHWSRHGHNLGFGVGMAHGYATMGRIGFEGRFDYSAIGSVVNLAARLCAEAQAGQILLDSKAFSKVESVVEGTEAGSLTLKGFQRPVPAYDVRALKLDA